LASNPPERPPVPASVEEAERTIRNQKFETVHVWGADGVYRFGRNGEASKVTMTDTEIAMVADSLFIHNHPSDYSFSDADIKFIAYANPMEFRAVGPQKRFSIIRPATGWPNDLYDEWLKCFRTCYLRYRKEFRYGKIKSESELSRRTYSDAMKRFTSAWNVEYRGVNF
jgi:hypothetical protein